MRRPRRRIAGPLRRLRRRTVNNTKYLVGLAGLVVGFLVSFLWVSSYNKSHAPVAAQSPTGSMPATTGSGGQQAMMGDVQQTIEKAKNNPKDFQAQLDAAEKFNSIQRLPETVEYLARAYEANPAEFMKRSDL